MHLCGTDEKPRKERLRRTCQGCEIDDLTQLHHECRMKEEKEKLI